MGKFTEVKIRLKECDDGSIIWSYDGDSILIEEENNYIFHKYFSQLLRNNKIPLTLSNIEEKLKLGNFTIYKPEEWDIKNVRLEIQDYDHDSTKINIDELKLLYSYIGKILNKENNE